jgi:hypothetical protein
MPEKPMNKMAFWHFDCCNGSSVENLFFGICDDFPHR